MLSCEDTSTLEFANWCARGVISVEGHFSHLLKSLLGHISQLELLLLLRLNQLELLVDGLLHLLVAGRYNLVPGVHLDGVLHELLLHRLGPGVLFEKIFEVDELFILDPVLVILRLIVVDVQGGPDRLVATLCQKRWADVPAVLMELNFIIRFLTSGVVLLLLLLLAWLVKILGRLTEEVHPDGGCLLLNWLLLGTLA